MAKKKHSELLASILYIIVGILLIIFNSTALDMAITISGVLFIIFGVLDILKRNWFGGAISLIIGIIILVLGKVALEIVLVVLGILIAIKGVVALIDVLRKSRKNALEVLFPILSIAAGLILAFGNGMSIVITLIGILLTIDGVLGAFGALKKKR